VFLADHASCVVGDLRSFIHPSSMRCTRASDPICPDPTPPPPPFSRLRVPHLDIDFAARAWPAPAGASSGVRRYLIPPFGSLYPISLKAPPYRPPRRRLVYLAEPLLNPVSPFSFRSGTSRFVRQRSHWFRLASMISSSFLVS